MLSEKTFRRIYRIGSWYDLIVTWPLATPFTLALLWATMNGLHAQMGLNALPVLGTYAVLFANMAGTVVLIWTILRIKWDDLRLARYDAAGRFAFSTWMIIAISNGASPLLYGFLAFEIVFGVLQALPYRPDDQGA